MSSSQTDDIDLQDKINALRDVAQFDPKFTGLIIVLGLVAAMFEGIGLSFVLPIIEIVQTDNAAAEADGLLAVFVTVYQTLRIPFTLGFVIVGVAVVMTLRYTSSFLVAWFREALRTYYMKDLQERAFRNSLDARVEYFDKEGSDDMLNAIITQTNYAGRSISRAVGLTQQLFLTIAYLLIAVAIAPWLTVFTITAFGALTLLLRYVLESGSDIGGRVADANEGRQKAAQAGTQGIRDIRIFGLADELYQDFIRAVEKFARSFIKERRNKAAINNFYNLGVSVSVFILIYLAITFSELSIGSLGVFLFAMFRLGPKVSKLNGKFYNLETDMPHLIRTQKFIQELEEHKEPEGGTREVPHEVDQVEFDAVDFSYEEERRVLQDISFKIEKDEFIAFVGQSGAGKSTIVSLLARFYQPDQGEILANGVPIHEMEITEWRDKISVVRQDPFIFNDTLRYNLKIGNREATGAELDRVCEIARVDEFFDELPDGYETMLGDDGVRLSGGQKQRVALARALLDESDLLVLDEATSDLDSNLEKEVQAAIEAMDREYAMITIAHRLSTVQNADRIYTMAAGEITEVGTHSELLDNNGMYEELYTIQSEA